MAVLFGDTIRNLRINKRMTQEELAKLIKVSRPMVSSYENNSRHPSHETLLRLASVLHTTMDELYGYRKDSQTSHCLDVSGIEKKHRILLEELADALRKTDF